jgi:methionyl-tRNA synthetase
LDPAREANVYLDRKAPWFQIKEDKAAAATTACVILRAVDNLKTILAPILPHTAQQLHEYLGYEGQPFGTQHVVEYQEETRSHRALTYDHSGAIGTCLTVVSVDTQKNTEYNVCQNQHQDEGKYNEDYPDDD